MSEPYYSSVEKFEKEENGEEERIQKPLRFFETRQKSIADDPGDSFEEVFSDGTEGRSRHLPIPDEDIVEDIKRARAIVEESDGISEGDGKSPGYSQASTSRTLPSLHQGEVSPTNSGKLAIEETTQAGYEDANEGVVDSNKQKENQLTELERSNRDGDGENKESPKSPRTPAEMLTLMKDDIEKNKPRINRKSRILYEEAKPRFIKHFGASNIYVPPQVDETMIVPHKTKPQPPTKVKLVPKVEPVQAPEPEAPPVPTEKDIMKDLSAELRDIGAAWVVQNGYHNVSLIMQGFLAGLTLAETVFAFNFATEELLLRGYRWMALPVHVVFAICFTFGCISAYDRITFGGWDYGGIKDTLADNGFLGVVLWSIGLVASLLCLPCDEVLAPATIEPKLLPSLLLYWRICCGIRAIAACAAWLLLALRPDCNVLGSELKTCMENYVKEDIKAKLLKTASKIAEEDHTRK